MSEAEPVSLARHLYRILAGGKPGTGRRSLASAALVVVVVASVPVILGAVLVVASGIGLTLDVVFPPTTGDGVLVSWGSVTVTTVLLLAVAVVTWWRIGRRTDDAAVVDGVTPTPQGLAEAGDLSDGSPSDGRRADRARITAIAFELGAYLVTALAMLWPLTFQLGSYVAGWRDARYYVWASWRAGEKLASGDFGLRIPEIVWPYGIDVRLVDGQLPTMIGGIWNLVASPELAHNLGLLTGIALNIWAGRRLGKAFSEHRVVWALTAIAFATAPAIAARLEVHFSMLYAFPVALLVEDAVRIARGERRLSVVRLAFLLLLAYLCGIYFLVFGAIAFGEIVFLATAPRDLLPLVLRAAGGVLLGLVLLSPFLIARFELDAAERAAGRPPELLSHTFVAQADGLSVATQPITSTIDIPGMDRLRAHFRENVHESTIFPGFILLAAVGGLLFLRSPLRWPLLLTAATVWLLALGTSLKIDGRFVVGGPDGRPIAWLPYTALFEVPGLASLRSPNRAGFTLAAVLTAALAAGLAWLFERFSRPWQRVSLIAVGGVLLATNLLVPIHRATIASSPELDAALRAVAGRVRPGESMIEVPAGCASQPHSAAMQILHRTPLVGCQTSDAAIPWASGIELYKTSEALAALRCRPRRVGGSVGTVFTPEGRFGTEEVDALRSDFGARFFMIHRPELGDGCEHVLGAVDVLERYETIGRDALWIVIDTGPIETGV